MIEAALGNRKDVALLEPERAEKRVKRISFEGPSQPLVHFNEKDPLAGRSFRLLKEGELGFEHHDLDELAGLLTNFGASLYVKAEQASSDREFTLEQCERYDETFLNRFFNIVADLIESETLDPKDCKTSSLSDLKFVNSKNQVVFESFGHMIHTGFLCEQEIFRQYRYLARKFRLAPNWTGTYNTPVHFMESMIESCSPNFERTEESQERHRDVQYDAHLLALDDYPENHPNDPSIAVKALREACLQVCGAIPRHIPNAIGHMYFSDKTRSIVVPGKRLVEDAQGYLSNNGQAVKHNVVARFISQGTSHQTLEEHVTQLATEHKLSPEVLFFALCSVGAKKDQVRTYRDFKTRLITCEEVEKSSDIQIEKDPLKAFSKVVERAVDAGNKVDFSELSEQRLLDLLRDLCSNAYGQDYKKMLKSLSDQAAILDDCRDPTTRAVLAKVLNGVVPKLVKAVEKVRGFKDPKTLREPLLPEQREAVVGAIYLDKPLVILDPGCGKTITAAAICETLKSERVLWCTKKGNIEGTRDKLRDEVLKGGRKVACLDPSWNKAKPSDLKDFLEANNYVSVGYETLRAMRKHYPENFRIVQEWVAKGEKVLDEAHVLDNHRSLVSQTLQELRSRNTVVTTATPVQHRAARIATILHLALPERYSDPASLNKTFSGNRELARAMMRRHATIYGVYDLADPIEDPSKVPYESQFNNGRPRVPRLSREY